MRPPLLLPEPHTLQIDRGSFVITEATTVCMGRGCGDDEYEAARELADAIRDYAQAEVFVERFEGGKPTPPCIVLRIERPEGRTAAPARTNEPEPPVIEPQQPSTLGDILRRAGLVSNEIVEELKEILRNEAGMTIREAVVRAGLVREEDILDAIAEEMGMLRINLRDVKVTPELIQILDPRVACNYKVFPVQITPDAIYLALADPMNLETVEDLERILGRKVIGMVAPEDEIDAAIRRYYPFASSCPRPKSGADVPRPKLSEILKRAGLLSEGAFQELERALEEQPCLTPKQAADRFPYLREEEILDAIAEELGFEWVSFDRLNITPELRGFLPSDIARKYGAIPVRVAEEAVWLALADPLNAQAVEDLYWLIGKDIKGCVAREEDVLAAIHRYYPEGAEEAARPVESQETPAEAAEPAKKAPQSASIFLEPYGGESYSLRIGRDRIDVTGSTNAGLFYGIQTLIQLVRFYGHRLPTLRIEDEPDFRYRGFMLDISRGRVPTLEYLQSLVRLLSHFKINMLQLYVEHTFQFASHPDIGALDGWLTPDEMIELDRYCRTRHVELVPCLQSFGHMGYLLSMPPFRRFAEIQRFEDWKAATWRQRMRGMTITPVDEGAYPLLNELYEDFLPCFQSRLFNLNSDETWDLGKGRSEALAAEIGVGRVYLRHIERIAALARKCGRTPMIWSDIIHQHPELIPEAPEGVIFLDWGYEHDSPFDRCARLAEARRPFFVCPGTSGWNQLFPDVWNSTLNIRRFVAAGKQHGAVGVLNTDWGDMGHFNLPACSYYGAVMGAAMAWNEGRPDENRVFDMAFALHVFDDRRDIVGRAIHRAGSLIREKVGRKIHTWELWATPLNEFAVAQEISPEAAQQINRALGEHIEALALLPGNVMRRGGVSGKEISFGLAMLDTLALRALIEHRALGTIEGDPIERFSYQQWADHVARLRTWFESLWSMRSKPSGLEEILQAFDRQIRDARRMRV